MSGESYEVQPVSREQLRRDARKVRKISAELTGEPEVPRFDIVRFLDITLPQALDDDFRLEILTEAEMRRTHGEAHAITFPQDQEIIVREDIWLRAESDEGRDRFTLAHELGHLLLHHRPGHARRLARTHTPVYRQSEWQANAFAGELLISADHLGGCPGPWAAPDIFGVTDQAADVQWKAFKRDGLV